MGKGTHLGFVPKDDPMFSTGPEIFSRPGSKQSTPTSPDATAGAEPKEPPQSNSPEPTTASKPSTERGEEGISYIGKDGKRKYVTKDGEELLRNLGFL